MLGGFPRPSFPVEIPVFGPPFDRWMFMWLNHHRSAASETDDFCTIVKIVLSSEPISLFRPRRGLFLDPTGWRYNTRLYGTSKSAFSVNQTLQKFREKLFLSSDLSEPILQSKDPD
jgi:hypothetical protein